MSNSVVVSPFAVCTGAVAVAVASALTSAQSASPAPSADDLQTVTITAIVDAASRRQKWIDQSQSVNLFLATPDLKTLSHMYRRAWDKGLKTTYYLRTLQASNIEKATIDVKKEVRGIAGGAKREYTAEEKNACSLEAMLNGGTCEACQ